jgi:hypothetical protein
MQDIHYTANMTVSGLLVPESRKISRLLLSGSDKVQWKTKIERDNILQKRNVASAVRVANFIKARLELMTPPLWELIAEGDSQVSAHGVFATAIKHSRLLGDFLDLSVREQFRRMEDRLTYRVWDEFIEGCHQRDPEMGEFPPSTAIKVRNSIFQVLHEAGYLQHRRTLKIQRVSIAPQIIRYLETNHETYVLRCIQVSP